MKERSPELQLADSPATVSTLASKSISLWGFAWGALIGTLGGLIGLGGGEFRMPVLLSFFGLRPMHAVILNLMTSCVTVTFSLLFRTGLGSLQRLTPYVPIVLNLLCGTLAGSFVGSHIAAKTREGTLVRVIAVCLIILSFALIGHDFIFQIETGGMPLALQFGLGIAAGFVIGLFSSILGVAGGELIIPTLILLFGVEIKLAGSLSLSVSLPTLLLGLVRYSRFPQFAETKRHLPLFLWLAMGSIAGALTGSLLLQHVSGFILTILLGVILLISAVRLLIHKPASG